MKRKRIAAAKSIGAHGLRADVSVEADAIALVQKTIELFPDYNVLINNAGFGSFGPLIDTDLAEMQRVFATNVFGAMVVARESARHFITRKRGNIINISSSAGVRGFAGGTAYAASKFAVSGMTECWRAELRKHDIRVMQINPSEVQTDFFRGGRPQSERKLRATEIAPRRPIDAGDGRPRLHHRAVGVGDESGLTVLLAIRPQRRAPVAVRVARHLDLPRLATHRAILHERLAAPAGVFDVQLDRLRRNRDRSAEDSRSSEQSS